MKNYAHKRRKYYINNDNGKRKTNRKDTKLRKFQKIQEAFRAMKKIFNVDVYNYESKIEENDANMYSAITTCESISENNSNAVRHNWRQKRRNLESELALIGQRNLKENLEEKKKVNSCEKPVEKTVVEKMSTTREEPNFVTVLTHSEVTETVKTDRLKSQKSKAPIETRKPKGDRETEKKNKEKPFFICYGCENLVPREVGIKCRKLRCHESKNCKQTFHSEEYLMIHKAKCHSIDQRQNVSKIHDKTCMYSDVPIDESEDSYTNEVYVQAKGVASKEIKRLFSEKKNRNKKHDHNGNSISSKFKDDLASKIVKKLIHRDIDTWARRRQKDNSNKYLKYKAKHMPFEWLDDDECDTSDTSIPSECTVSCEIPNYSKKEKDATIQSEMLTKPEVHEEVHVILTPKNIKNEIVQLKKDTTSGNNNRSRDIPSRFFSNAGDGLQMTKEKFVSMNFMFDHPDVEKKRLAITNNIKLRVVDSSTADKDFKHRKNKSKKTEKKKMHNDGLEVDKSSNNFEKQVEKDKKTSHSKEEARTMKNVNNSEVDFHRQTAVAFQHCHAKETNDNNHRCIPCPCRTAPGKYFQGRSSTNQYSEPLPLIGDTRANFRPSSFACTHLQSQLPSQFWSSSKSAFPNDPCCQYTPTLYNYNHRQPFRSDIMQIERPKNIPNLPWTIMARRMENMKSANDPPQLKYTYKGHTPHSSNDRRKKELPSRTPTPRYTHLSRTTSNIKQRQSTPRVPNYTAFRGVERSATPRILNSTEYLNNRNQSNVSKRLENIQRARQMARNSNRRIPDLKV